ncbi:protein RALF-like 34 [Cornus florida]|uniref:protein RALF-like 34 n=1 Tax=Cornus florida TaxID=4283 RepID=UPI002899062D|nr:protein RALF-like 34 [Cornus florida]
MASPQPLKLLLLLCFTVVAFNCISHGQGGEVEETSIHLMTEALEWPSLTSMSLYDDDEGDMEEGRRSLFWRALRHYYISYGALSANRIPCPPRSGRSYYTHNCYRARGPVHPYTRGCSAITRCRR